MFKVTARDQGHYKGPSGHLLHTVTFLVFFLFFFFDTNISMHSLTTSLDIFPVFPDISVPDISKLIVADQNIYPNVLKYWDT